MSDKVIKRNKIISVRGDLYDSISLAAQRAGCTREDNTPDVGKYVSETFSSLGLETDDVKFVFRVPKNVSNDPSQLKLFLQSQVDKAVTLV